MLKKFPGKYIFIQKQTVENKLALKKTNDIKLFLCEENNHCIEVFCNTTPCFLS